MINFFFCYWDKFCCCLCYLLSLYGLCCVVLWAFFFFFWWVFKGQARLCGRGKRGSSSIMWEPNSNLAKYVQFFFDRRISGNEKMRTVTTNHIRVLILELDDKGIRGQLAEHVIKWLSIKMDDHKHIITVIKKDSYEHIKCRNNTVELASNR